MPHTSTGITNYILFLVLICLVTNGVSAKNELIWDEKLGITSKEQAQKFRIGNMLQKEKSGKEIKIKGNTAQDYFNMGKRFYADGDYKEAMEYFKIAYSKEPEVAIYYYWIGACNLNMANYENAKTYFSRITKIYRNSDVADDALFFLGFLAQRENNYGKAQEYYREVIDFYSEGISATNKQKFRPIARAQLNKMGIEIKDWLNTNDIEGNNDFAGLKIFQVRNKLEPTGIPDSITVSLLTFKSDSLKDWAVKMEKIKLEAKDKRIKYTGAICISFIIGLSLSAVNLMSFSGKRERLSALQREYR
ncbi:MAG: tetratricopeptide repeat protein [bacterium]